METPDGHKAVDGPTVTCKWHIVQVETKVMQVDLRGELVEHVGIRVSGDRFGELGDTFGIAFSRLA